MRDSKGNIWSFGRALGVGDTPDVLLPPQMCCCHPSQALPLQGTLQIPFLGAAGREGLHWWNGPSVAKLSFFPMISLSKGGGSCVCLIWVY